MRSESFIPTRRSRLSRLKNWEDDGSWRDFYDTYGRFIRSVALRSGLSETEAEEVLQETLITVAKNISRFRYDPARGSFKGWLMTILRSRIVDQMRRRPPLARPGVESLHQ